MINYTLGFLFDYNLTKVALIRKLKPDWQKNKLNGVGGKIEVFDQTYLAGLIREYREETTYTADVDWVEYATMSGPDFNVHCFAGTGDVDNVKALTKEVIDVINVSDITNRRGEMIDNLPWLIYIAMDTLCDGRPSYTTIIYKDKDE